MGKIRNIIGNIFQRKTKISGLIDKRSECLSFVFSPTLHDNKNISNKQLTIAQFISSVANLLTEVIQINRIEKELAWSEEDKAFILLSSSFNELRKWQFSLDRAINNLNNSRKNLDPDTKYLRAESSYKIEDLAAWSYSMMNSFISGCEAKKENNKTVPEASYKELKTYLQILNEKTNEFANQCLQICRQELAMLN